MLRQLIQAEAAQDSTDPRHSAVTGAGLLDHGAVIQRGHRPELVDLEQLVVQPDPPLPEENRAGRIQADQDGHPDHDRHNEDQGETGYHQIKHSLCDTLRGGKRNLAKPPSIGRTELLR
jgi:hypothetical protein